MNSATRKRRRRRQIDAGLLFKCVVVSLVVLCSLAPSASMSPPLTQFGTTDMLWTSVPSAPFPLAPTCSFAALELPSPPDLVMPSADKSLPDVVFPRGRDSPTLSYIGLQVWNSRGDMALRRAVQAMLGDPHAYFESAMFTAYKLLALGKTHELPSKVYGSGSGSAGQQRTSHGYHQFYSELTTRVINETYMERFPRAENEVEAVLLAKALLDDVFGMPASEIRRGYLDAQGGHRMEDPYFVLYSTMVHQKAAAVYGPEVLVLAPEARLRGIDAHFYKLRRSVEEARGRGALSAGHFVELVGHYNTPGSDKLPLCDCSMPDFGELLTPGYHLPGHVLGIEFYDHGFYKVEYGGRVLVAVLQTDGRCVVQDESSSTPAFRFCGGDEQCPAGDTAYCGVLPLRPLEPPQPVPAVAVLYATQGGNPSAAAAGAADARNLLEVLNAGQPKRARQPALSPFTRPPELLAALQDLAFTGGGVAVGAILMGENGEPVAAALNGAAMPLRPAAAEVLRARKRALSDAQAGLGLPAEQEMLLKRGGSIAIDAAPSEPPPIWVLLAAALTGSIGDLLQQSVVRKHLPMSSDRLLLLANTGLGCLITLAAFIGLHLVAPGSNRDVYVGSERQTCYFEVDYLGGPASDCFDGFCMPVPCPAQGPLMLGFSLALHPSLCLFGVLALFYLATDAALSKNKAYVSLRPAVGVLASLMVRLTRPDASWARSGSEFVLLILSGGSVLLIAGGIKAVRAQAEACGCSPAICAPTAADHARGDSDADVEMVDVPFTGKDFAEASSPGGTSASARGGADRGRGDGSAFNAASGGDNDVAPLLTQRDSADALSDDSHHHGHHSVHARHGNGGGVGSGHFVYTQASFGYSMRGTNAAASMSPRGSFGGHRSLPAWLGHHARSMVAGAHVASVLLASSGCTAAWGMFQVYANREFRVNIFGFLSLDYLLAPVFLAAWVLATPKSAHSGISGAMTGPNGGLSALLKWRVLVPLTASRALGITRSLVYFWLTINYDLSGTILMATVTRNLVSWAVMTFVSWCLPSFAQTGRIAGEPTSRREEVLDTLVKFAGVLGLSALCMLIYKN